MQYMKKIIGLLAFTLVLLLAVPMDAKAQEFNQIRLFGGAGTQIAANTATTVNTNLGVIAYDEFLIDCSYALILAGGTTNIDLRWCYCADGTNAHSIVAADKNAMISIPANGLSTVTFITNFTSVQYPYWRLVSVSNGNLSIVSNVQVNAYFRPGKKAASR